MKILVTGGAGYIGSFMTKRLLEQGYNVVVLDSLERGHKETIDTRAKFVQLSLLQWEPIEKLFKEEMFDAIVHFAGYISMEESVRDPGIYFYNNTAGALDIIEHAVKNNVKSFIFSSTAGVYGNPTKIPIPEDHQTHPTNPYGESKLMVEKILSWYRKSYRLRFVSLRYFNAAGAALDGNMGENHNPETHIIPNAINAALTNSDFLLYGQDYDTLDGTCIRDYIHVVDLIDAHLLALKKLETDDGGFFYNAGVGKGYSNKEVLNMIEKVTGSTIKIRVEDRRLGDAEILVADPSKIKHDLQFSPHHSDLETIVKSAHEWYKKLKVKNEK